MIDPYLWLEDLDSPDALRWVSERNAETLASLADAEFARLRDAVREVLDSKERISFPAWGGDGFYYDFWRDADHPRGLWRRTTPEEFRCDEPDWDVLLDLDALNAAEGTNWTWGGATVLRPGYDRCLISLARGGSDAVVVREFDLVARAFVKDGFALPEAKSDVGWIDADHIFVATDFGDGSLTSSGYARIVKRWRRGTPLSEAETVFEGQHDDVLISASHDPAPGFERDFVVQRVEFFRTRYHLRRPDGELVRIEIPEDADFDVHREWMLIRLRTPWREFPAGALIVTDFDDFLAGGRDLTVLFQPDDRTSLSSYAWTRHHLLLATLADVKTRIEILTPGSPSWTREPLDAAGEFDNTWIVDTEPESSDAYLIASEGFLQPASLRLGASTVLKREPAFFDTDGLAVRQHFAVSADGTRVPYFVVGGDGCGPALLTGYGGFEISRTPDYGGVRGRGWLARGGAYILANIRGGGEYGPAWHQAALRENRTKAYEDFAAVARDLVDRGITTPAQLGITGGSNGGLLMGVMLTRYPELFGAVVAAVPLLDMRRYTKLLAGKSWIAEYGDPDVPGDWEFLRGYSPYQNVRPDRPYPPVLFLTSTRDDRVHPGHARKMLALLRENGHEAWLYENVEGGHGAAADNEQAATREALCLEFLWRKLHQRG
ncbi:putative prolyl oligopeptidase [Actinoplanes missouriensis 431]|uniref:Putative prolyl oligopeptidase n=1 Tax=Actinoplanes missouriensis (strain ATCC 14538 / DSM 43046 / CBS 188.64 / JCM 3121 / NBRC 102363 / NCIMB 12654 / NRRL B-3342 / UNCC 431) TaxID=512565 RepID=I0H0D4_ACTM4|nr:prolyl oligopeptidase family serine peptidase [Actinoplanes missouriensis]BAL86471.1 putative prolyl oligopeptidase [Actinoplanes missouriensis 431]